MSEKEKISKVDQIHHITTYPLFEKFMKGDFILPDFLSIESGSIESLYLEYCMNAYNIDSRDYNFLRNILKLNVIENCNLIERKMFKCMLGYDLHKDKISQIYDIGAGHDEYSSILQKMFSNANITLIDKVYYASQYNLIETNIFDWIDKFKGNSNTLVFISEFLHCKENNLDILDNKELKKCHVLINELEHNEFINYRLSLTGGKLIEPADIIKTKGVLQNQKCIVQYKTLFEYYMLYLKPAEVK